MKVFKKKIYLVTEFEYDEDCGQWAFSTREKADKFLQKSRFKDYMKNRSNNKISGRTYWHKSHGEGLMLQEISLD